jgi:hypothetical protein
MAHLTYTKNFNENLLMLLLRDHQRYMPIVEFFDNVTQHLSELSWGEAELIAAEVSRKNCSEFCDGIRNGMTNALYANPELLKSEKFAPLLDFALKVHRDATSIGRGDIESVIHVGWSEQTVEDVVALVAAQKLYNTIAAGLGFKGVSPAAFAAIAQDTVNKGGYAESFRSFIALDESNTAAV